MSFLWKYFQSSIAPHVISTWAVFKAHKATHAQLPPILFSFLIVVNPGLGELQHRAFFTLLMWHYLFACLFLFALYPCLSPAKEGRAEGSIQFKKMQYVYKIHTSAHKPMTSFFLSMGPLFHYFKSKNEHARRCSELCIYRDLNGKSHIHKGLFPVSVPFSWAVDFPPPPLYFFPFRDPTPGLWNLSWLLIRLRLHPHQLHK